MTPSSKADASESGSTNTSADTSTATTRTILPQFAIDAADAKIATWSSAIVDAADTIERLIGAESLPVPASVRDLATSTTDKLRSFGVKSGEQNAAELVASLQRTAAAHPAASIGVGAAIGAALAALLVKVGGPSPAIANARGADAKNDAATERSSDQSTASGAERRSPSSTTDTK